MLYFLELRRDKDVRLLPTSEQTASLVERALLAAQTAERRQYLARALQFDPFFATGIRFLARRAQENANSLPQLAEWFADDLPGKLASVLARTPAQSLRRIPDGDADAYARAAIAAMRDESRLGVWPNLLTCSHQLLETCPRDLLGSRRLLPSFPPVRCGTVHDSGANDSEKLAAYLEVVPNIQWRLPALADRLTGAKASADEFKRQLEQAKLASLEEFAYGASHEINNPLANIAMRAQALARDEPDEDRIHKLNAIYKQAMRAHEMIADLMLFARPPAMCAAPVRIADVVREAIFDLREEAGAAQVDLRHAIEDGDSELLADGTQLSVAIRELVRNAIEASPNDSVVEVRTFRIDEPATICVSVGDEGPGISERIRRHMFDPFFSGREAGRGLGFGLCKSWRIVKEHGGTIHVDSRQAGGAIITIKLPMNVASARAA